MEEYNLEECARKIRTKWVGRNIHFFEEIDSTNLQAQREAAAGAGNGTLLIADKQTAGRGRRGREWDSPAGNNVYFTLLLRPDFASDKASMVTLVMAYAVWQGIGKSLPAGAFIEKLNSKNGIKWPNDIVVQGRKVCGILTEMSLSAQKIDYVAIGVGINVGKQQFASQLQDRAISLEEVCGEKISRSQLVANIMEAFEQYYEQFQIIQDLSFLTTQYNACLVNKDKEISVLDPKGEYQGVAKGINQNGELLVELADGSVEQVYAGEVSVRGIYGYV